MKEQEYRKKFGLGGPLGADRAEKALEHALDIRKFEIGLYWQRATYFWALIAVAFAGYFAVLGADNLADKEYLAYIVGCVGLVFTWAWFLANRGSKFWQENWENHVDMLEDAVTGPLYKTVLSRPKEKSISERYITGPLPVSVSKINQWVSLFTIIVWIFLIFHALPRFDLSRSMSIRRVLVAIVATAACYAMASKGKTHKKSYSHIAKERATRIVDS